MLDEEDEPAVAPHEHNYVRAIKQSPTMMGSVVERVEHLLKVHDHVVRGLGLARAEEAADIAGGRRQPDVGRL